MNPKRKIDYIDLFCGIGGFHIALKKFGTKCVFASEWDKNCQDVYFDNFKIKTFLVISINFAFLG